MAIFDPNVVRATKVNDKKTKLEIKGLDGSYYEIKSHSCISVFENYCSASLYYNKRVKEIQEALILRIEDSGLL